MSAFANQLVKDILNEQSATFREFIATLLQDLFQRYRPELVGEVHATVVPDGLQLTGQHIRLGIFTLDLDARRLTAGRPRRASHTQGLRPAGRARLRTTRRRCRSPSCKQRLWADTFVVEANLSNLVAEIREALGDRARTPVFIRTAHGFGYAFCGEAMTLASQQDIGFGRSRGAGSSGTGGDSRSRLARTSSDAIRTSRSDSIRRRSRAGTRESS